MPDPSIQGGVPTLRRSLAGYQKLTETRKSYSDNVLYSVRYKNGGGLNDENPFGAVYRPDDNVSRGLSAINTPRRANARKSERHSRNLSDFSIACRQLG